MLNDITIHNHNHTRITHSVYHDEITPKTRPGYTARRIPQSTPRSLVLEHIKVNWLGRGYIGSECELYLSYKCVKSKISSTSIAQPRLHWFCIKELMKYFVATSTWDPQDSTMLLATQNTISSMHIVKLSIDTFAKYLVGQQVTLYHAKTNKTLSYSL